MTFSADLFKKCLEVIQNDAIYMTQFISEVILVTAIKPRCAITSPPSWSAPSRQIFAFFHSIEKI